MPFDEVEENIYPFGWSKGRVVLLVRPIGVVEAGEYLSNPFHPRRLAHCRFSANDQPARRKARARVPLALGSSKSSDELKPVRSLGLDDGSEPLLPDVRLMIDSNRPEVE